MKADAAICFAFAFGGIGLLTLTAAAQPGGGTFHTSLEARVAQAPLVFRATITRAAETIVHTNSPTGSYDFANYAVAFQVDEILKGMLPRRTLGFSIRHVALWPDLPRWADERVSILWFGEVNESTMGEDFHGSFSVHVVWLGPTQPGAQDPSPGLLPPVYAMDLTVLHRPADILARARAFAKKPVGSASFHRIRLPQGSSDDHYFFNTCVQVPVVPALEATARNLIAAPGDFLATDRVPAATEARLHPAWCCDLRSEGVSALRYFKAARNVRLLKSLLAAPDCWTTRDWSTEYRDLNVTNRIYSVRQKAYEVLQGWGVEVPLPVFQERVSCLGGTPPLGLTEVQPLIEYLPEQRSGSRQAEPSPQPSVEPCRVACAMEDGRHFDRIQPNRVVDGVGKSTQHSPACCGGNRPEPLGIDRHLLDGFVYRVPEFSAQAGPLLLLPSDRVFEFHPGQRREDDRAFHALLLVRRSRSSSRTVSQGMPRSGCCRSSSRISAALMALLYSHQIRAQAAGERWVQSAIRNPQSAIGP